jgi:glucokinase
MEITADIGGSNGRVVIYDGSPGAEYAKEEFKITQVDPMTATAQELEQAFAADYTAFLEAIRRAQRQAAPSQKVGIALAGKLNQKKTALDAAGNLAHWVGRPIVELLRKELKLPVKLGNDAEAAALAEAHFGHGKGTDFWFVIWGTGIGGCLVRMVNGKPVAFAGEPGHQVVNSSSGLMCKCGQVGCLEAFAGGAGIANLYGKPAELLTKDEWRETLLLVEAGVRNLVTIQPVPLVIFGGGIANKQSWMLDEIQRGLATGIHIVKVPKIRLSAFGESAGNVGALALLQN